ncbi:hypothetical protein ABH935_000637 [Catenulispora sp. GAS73]|uniref:hypothetical protein n=1 Tax=Catenulispora sp. GAS73 TaxID=3156269 RepID=UPI003516822C
MASTNDLQLDLDGIDNFATALDGVVGQLNGTGMRLGDEGWLAGDKDLCAALDDFTGRWLKAAPLIDSYAKQLSGMARDCVARFRQADTAMARSAPTTHSGGAGGHIRAVMD